MSFQKATSLLGSQFYHNVGNNQAKTTNRTSVRNVIVEAVLGSEARLNYLKYADRSTDWPHGRPSDVLSAPSEVADSLPPVLVEVQNTIDVNFAKRTIQYCLAVNEQYGISPIVVVFGIHPTRIANDLVQSDQLPYAKEYPCKPWAKSFYVLDPITIHSHVQKQPMEPLVAIERFLHRQKRTLLDMGSKERADETIKMLYAIARAISESIVTLEERTIDVLSNACEQAQERFRKIKEACDIEDVEELRKRTREYAEDGDMHMENCKRKLQRTLEFVSTGLPEEAEEDGPSTSERHEDILQEEAGEGGPSTSERHEDILPEESEEGGPSTSERHEDILPEESEEGGPFTSERTEDILPASDQPNTVSPDFAFVENFRSTQRRMNWGACFNAGRAQDLFTSYRDSKSLNASFFKAQKHKQ
ncbi:hypothetical protein K450DRAFT_277623 [Umbelopsis ramanniana AG]|uniref:Uncharacterized protein n=1 Tax=Umbelopsis ramanniana AG TaxID=1314678 RepID=A0AAD5EIX5_UMBRA|nr:uncharacterized protein K450DRAFT_277623 [Umbelopsis ramanniana AG]KAI8583135.1 hypothetical protein K450DRAFT_277623 [Umbelopsis ramanniana AG]